MVRVRLSLLDKLNLFLGIYGQLFAGLIRFSWYSPFFILALFQLWGMAMLLWYYAPIWISIIGPILSLFLPPQAFHYPQYYLALPAVYAGFERFIMGPTLWIIILAVAIFRLNGVLIDRKRPALQEGFQVAFDRYLRLLVIWLIETIIVLFILYVPSVALRNYTNASPNLSAALGMALQTGGLLAVALLIYATVGIVIGNKKLGEAVSHSVIMFFRYPIMTFSAVFIPNVLRLILNAFLADYAPRIISLMNPDLIPVILTAYIVAGIFINYFVYGTAVALYRELE